MYERLTDMKTLRKSIVDQHGKSQYLKASLREDKNAMEICLDPR